MDNDFTHSDHGYLSGAVLCYPGSHALGESGLAKMPLLFSNGWARL
jgi:hypothetical protein